MSCLVILELFHISSSPYWNFNLKRLLCTSWFYTWCLYLLGASTSAPACPCRLRAAQRPPFAQRFPAKWVHTQTCFAAVLPEDLGDQPLSYHNLDIICLYWTGTEYTYFLHALDGTPKPWDAAFTIDAGTTSILVNAEKHKYLSSVNYIKKVKAYLNYEWGAASARLGRVTFKGVYI